MKSRKEQSAKALRLLVAALDHQAQVLHLKSRRARDARERSRMAEAARLSTALSEEIAAIGDIKRGEAELEPDQDRSLARDLSSAFRLCLGELPLGPVRDHVVRGYLRLSQLGTPH